MRAELALWRQRELAHREDHIARLYRSLRYVRIDIGLTQDELIEISHELLEHNAGMLPEGDELGLIQFVTPGEYKTYAGSAGTAPRLTPTVCVHTFPLPFELWADPGALTVGDLDGDGAVDLAAPLWTGGISVLFNRCRVEGSSCLCGAGDDCSDAAGCHPLAEEPTMRLGF